MSKRPKVTTDASPLTSNPFASLLADGPELPDGAPVDAAEEAAAADEPTAVVADLGGRLVVRRQKKGQGGKTVTCVEGLPADGLAPLLRRLKAELGCSGRVEGAVLIAGTGEHERVAKWLRGAGAKRVVLGN